MTQEIDKLSDSILDDTLKRADLSQETPTLKTPEARDGYLLANLYRRTGDYENAIRAYRRLIALEPQFAPAYYYLGFSHYKEGEFEEAEQALEQAIRLDPEHPEFYFTLGLLRYDMRDYRGALECFTRAIALRPAWIVQAYCYRGLCYTRLGELEKAEQDYQNALDLEPERLDALHRLGMLYLQQRKWHEAEALFRRSLAIHSEDADAHYYLGEIAAAQHQWQEAAEHFERAIALDPTHPEARFQAAALYAKQRYMQPSHKQRYRKQAIHHLRELIQAYQEFPEFFESIGQAYFLLGSLYDDTPEGADGAISAYQKGLQYTPSAAAHNNLGVLYWRKDRIEEASREFRAAIQLDPDYDGAYSNLAKLYFYRQDEQMMRDFEMWIYRQQVHAAKILYKLSLALIDVARSEAYQGLYSRIHQVKNLIGLSGAKIRAAQRLLETPEEARRQLEAALEETQVSYDELVHLLQSLKQEDLHLEFLDLNRLVKNLVDYLTPTLEAAGVQCELALADGLPQVKADPRQLKEALHNLVLNAVEAMEDGGSLQITSAYVPQRSEVVLRIRDTGRGIPSSQRQVVFKPGYTTKPHGSGFGLNIVERILRAHRGRITLESSEGRGSTFNIALPVDLEAAPAYTTLQMRPILYEAPDDLISDEEFV